MNHTAEIVDISRLLAAEQLPEVTLPLGSGEAWEVFVTPELVAQPGQSLTMWVRTGELVRIPLVPHRLTGVTASEVILGVLTIATQRQEAISAASKQVHWVVGEPVETVPEQDGVPAGFRLWLGVAVRRK